MEIKIISASVQGASHKRRGIECQDSYKYFDLDNAVILAVADGHGSESCPFSKSGSTIAVNTFCDLMYEYCNRYTEDMSKLLAYFNREGDTTVAREIDKEWKRRVEKCHKDNKREVIRNDKNEIDKTYIWHKYGTTLIGLVITPTFYFAFQIGDGDLLYLCHTEAKHIIQIEKILGVETHSLSSVESWKKSITAIGHLSEETGTKSFLLATDGFANSYSNESDFLQACSDYNNVIRKHGVCTVSKNLKNWLNETSENGSGDDITMLFAVLDGETNPNEFLKENDFHVS